MFVASFDALKAAPSLTSDQDVLAPLSDGVMALHESLDSGQLTNGMVDICVDIVSRQNNETKYPTTAEKNSICALRKMASSSPYAFKALSKLASPAFQGGGSCVNLEAARSLGEAVNDNDGSSEKGSGVIDALANLIEAEQEASPAKPDDLPSRYWREASLEHMGEMLLPILRSGLSKLQETRLAREKMVSEYERLSEAEEASCKEEADKERKIWDGVLKTLERFLRPKHSPPPENSRCDNGSVVDTALAVLGVVMGFAEGEVVGSGITECLARSCEDCIDAAKWIAVNSSGARDGMDPDAELRVVGACMVNLVMAVEDRRPGAKESLTKIALSLLGAVVQGGKILTRVCDFSEAAPQTSPKNAHISQPLDSPHSPKR